jgi:glutamyl-tRNA reductase
MQPALMVIGLNHTTAPVSVRERFWMDEETRKSALLHLFHSESIEEVIILCTCSRTEFLLWASDPSLAANSVLRFLASKTELKLCDWVHFYRLLDDRALLQILRMVSGLDSAMMGLPVVAGCVKSADAEARVLGTSGKFLNSVLERAFQVRERVYRETEIAKREQSLADVVVEVSQQIFGSLARTRVLLVQGTACAERAVQELQEQGAGLPVVADVDSERAQEIASRLGGSAVSFMDLRAQVRVADVVIIGAHPKQRVLTREDVETIMRQRDDRPLVLIDADVPRSVDLTAKELRGVALYNIDDLERIAKRKNGHGRETLSAGLRIVTEEAQGFLQGLLVQSDVPTIVALRQRLDQICRQELESFKEECGPFSKDQDEILSTVTSRLTQKIAGSLARELKDVPEKVIQQQMTAAVQRLFHLQSPETALAGASSERTEVCAH